MEECPNCKYKYAKKPIKDQNGKIIWKNMFYMSVMDIMFLLLIIALIISYKYETKQCFYMMEQSEEFCNQLGYTYIEPENPFVKYFEGLNITIPKNTTLEIK